MIADWNVYQEGTAATAIYPGTGTKLGLLYVTLGSIGETGEVAEHAKKCIRDDGGILLPSRRDALIKELGDVTWYCASVGREARFTLEGSRITNPINRPEKAEDYVGRGTPVGLGYMCARLAIEIGKLAELALVPMPYKVPDGEHWSDVGQGRVIQSRLSVAAGRVLWYVERVAGEAGSTIDHVMSENLVKLASRKERGVLHGDGSGR